MPLTLQNRNIVNFIVFDLEATCWENKPSNKVQETIEIGAFLINSYGEEVKRCYSRFIRPVVNPYLSKFCMDLTSIQQEQVDRADKFDRVIEDFQDWAEVFDEEYMLCSWGDFDKKILQNDCKLHKLDDFWLEPHINLKKQYQDIKRLKKPRGLKTSIEIEGFEFTGVHHRAIDDAENLAKLFLKYLDEWRT